MGVIFDNFCLGDARGTKLFTKWNVIIIFNDIIEWLIKLII
jgi:hypothetical protein